MDAGGSEIVIKNDTANYILTKSSLERLKPGRWLNDEVLNAYISLVNLRSTTTHAFVFNTFFYTMLEDMHGRGSYSYTKCERVLKRKKVDLRATGYRHIVFPINVRSSHWYLAVYIIDTKEIVIVDSLISSSYSEVRDILSTFLKDYFKLDPATVLPVIPFHGTPQ
jgi:sentrin-specific protease 1